MPIRVTNSAIQPVLDCDLMRRRILIGSTALALAPLLPRWSHAQTATPSFDYYISPTGSNSNPGTQAQPWAISALSTKPAIAGRRIGLLNGTYVVANTNFETAGPATISFGGSAAAHTVVEAVNPQQAIVTGWNGSSYVGTQGLIGTNGADYVTIRGLRVTNGRLKGIVVWGSKEVLIENCQVDNIQGEPAGDNCDGIRIEEATNVTIRSCHIFNVRNGADSPNAACVKTYATTNCIIEFCELSDSSVAIYDKLRGPVGTVLRYCYIHDCSNQQPIRGFDDGSSGVYKIHNNIIVSVGVLDPQDTEINGCNTYLEVFNNTYVATGTASTGAWKLLSAGPFVKFYNNIIYRPGFGAGYRGDLNITSAANAPIVDFNCYDASAVLLTLGSGPSSSYSSLPAWRSATGKDVNSFQANPSFVGTGTGASRYQLTSSSACRSKGRIGGLAGGLATDLGAWQSGVTQIGCDLSVSKVIAPKPPESVTAE